MYHWLAPLSVHLYASRKIQNISARYRFTCAIMEGALDFGLASLEGLEVSADPD